MYWFSGWASPSADPDFNAHVAHPAYPSSIHPRVYFDAGHWNEDPYKPFVDLMRNDGYAIETHKGTLGRDALASWNILVLANALGFRDGAKQIPGLLHNLRGDAFSAGECSAVRDWVRDGDSMLLVTDYSPTSKSAAKLAVGQALDFPQDAEPFLKLSPLAREYPYREGSDNSQYSSAAGAAQGVAMGFGKGRLLVIGDGAVLTSQVSSTPGGPRLHYEMGYSGYDDRQLALNVMHWLSRAIN